MDCSTPGRLSITNSWSLLRLVSIESVMPPNHLILCHPLLLPSVSPALGSFPVSQPHQVAKGLELQVQHQSFQLHGLHCPEACGILVSQPGIKPMSHALGSRFFTPGPPGKPLSWVWMVPLLPPLPPDCASTDSAPCPSTCPPRCKAPGAPCFPLQRLGSAPQSRPLARWLLLHSLLTPPPVSSPTRELLFQTLYFLPLQPWSFIPICSGSCCG